MTAAMQTRIACVTSATSTHRTHDSSEIIIGYDDLLAWMIIKPTFGQSTRCSYCVFVSGLNQSCSSHDNGRAECREIDTLADCLLD